MPANIDIFINGKDKTGPAIGTAKGGLRSLAGEADAATGKFNAMTVAVGTVVGNLATSAITKMGQFASSIVTTGIGFDNMKQQADIAFTTMLGSGEKAKSFLDKLQAFAAKTPFEFPDLLTGAQRMLAMGFEADEVLPTLTAIGDAVAGMGGGAAQIDQVTRALGQMQAKGKASAEEMLQLTEAGIPAWQFLADAIGTDVAGAMDKVSKGAVSADVVIGAVVDGMNKKFGGMMEQQSKTFGGLWSTIKDTFTQISGQVMTPLFDQMTRGFQMIVDWTGSPAFTAGVKALTGWMEKLGFAAGVFFDSIEAGRTPIDALADAISTLIPNSVFDIWVRFTNIVRGVYEAARLLVTGDFRGGIFGLQEDAPFINALFIARDGAKYLYDQALKLIAKFQEWAGNVLPPLANGLFAVVDHVNMIIAAVKKVFKPVGDTIAKFLGFEDVLNAAGAMLLWMAATAIPPLIAGLTSFLAPIAGVVAAVAAMRFAWEQDLGGIRTFTLNTVQKISDWFFKESGIWKGTWEATWVYVADRVRYFFQIAIPYAINGFTSGAKFTFQQWFIWARDNWTAWVEKTKQTIEHWASVVQYHFNHTRDLIIEAWNKWVAPTIKEISDWVIVTKSHLGNWAQYWIDKVMKWKDDVLALFQPVFDWWDKHIDPWIQKGKDLIQGFWNGIKQRWGEFTGWFRGVWEDLVDRFKNFFGIHSPSALFASYGRFLMEGFAGGIAQHQSLVQAEIDSLTNSVTAKMERLKGAMVQSTADINAILAQAVPSNMQVIGVVPGANGQSTAIYGPAPSAGGSKPVTPAPVIPVPTLGGAVGGPLTTGATGQALLGGINVATPDIKGAQEAAKAAAAKVKDFISGIGDFLGGTVDNRSMSKVFQSLDSNLTGIVELRKADEAIRKNMADLLGVSTLYGRLTDSMTMVMEKITAGTDLNKVANLLQSAVDFRTLANHYSTADYANVLPTDPRLTGTPTATTNNYNITLQGSNNANADVLGLVQLLGSLQGSVAP